ncbi:hypothetical protein GCM10009836_29450 [Pseudonocardia ailaonensis]|uniref:PucR C-terminal helix-turn-helix domain-containing protein n=1 Tax=Pseudonocardia ailaonensis TaxID=367279 RepID=A0ABN2N2I5_9PSEU
MGRAASTDRSVAPDVWTRFSTAFALRLGGLEQDIVDRMADLRSYRRIPEQVIQEQVVRGLTEFRCLVADRRPLGRDGKRLYLSIAGQQSDDGIVLDDVIRAWRLGADVLVDWARREVTSSGLPEAVLTDFLDLTIPWREHGTTLSVCHFRRVRSSAVATDPPAHVRFLCHLGTRPVSEAAALDGARRAGLDCGVLYSAVRARRDDDSSLGAVEAWGELTGDPRDGIAAVVDGQVWGLLRRVPAGGIDLPVGIAPPARLSELRRSFATAGRALDAAVSLGLRGCHGLGELGARPAVIGDEGVGDALVERYVLPIVALGAGGVDILRTVRVYLDHQGNCERAGAELFVHPNTVRYRIRRFESETDCSLRRTSTFVAVWWALERHDLAYDTR